MGGALRKQKMFWILRLDDYGQFTKEELKSFFNKHTAFKMVHEYKSYNPNKGPHIQGWIECDVAEDTMRKWIKKEIHCKGNKHYALKNKAMMEKHYESEEGYYRYVCKGESKDKPPIEFYNITPEDTLRLHKEFYETRVDWNKRREEEKNTLDKQLDSLIGNNMLMLQVSPHEEIVRLIIEFYDTRNKSITNNQLENKYIYYRQKIHPEWKKIRVQLIHEKLMLRN